MPPPHTRKRTVRMTRPGRGRSASRGRSNSNANSRSPARPVLGQRIQTDATATPGAAGFRDPRHAGHYTKAGQEVHDMAMAVAVSASQGTALRSAATPDKMDIAMAPPTTPGRAPDVTCAASLSQNKIPYGKQEMEEEDYEEEGKDYILPTPDSKYTELKNEIGDLKAILMTLVKQGATSQRQNTQTHTKLDGQDRRNDQLTDRLQRMEYGIHSNAVPFPPNQGKRPYNGSYAKKTVDPVTLMTEDQLKAAKTQKTADTGIDPSVRQFVSREMASVRRMISAKPSPPAAFSGTSVTVPR